MLWFAEVVRARIDLSHCEEMDGKVASREKEILSLFKTTYGAHSKIPVGFKAALTVCIFDSSTHQDHKLSSS